MSPTTTSSPPSSAAAPRSTSAARKPPTAPSIVFLGLIDGANGNDTFYVDDADDTLLDTYTAERHEHAKAMIDLSMTFGAITPLHAPPELIEVVTHTALFSGYCYTQVADTFRRTVMVLAGRNDSTGCFSQSRINSQFRLALHEVAARGDQSRDSPDFRLRFRFRGHFGWKITIHAFSD